MIMLPVCTYRSLQLSYVDTHLRYICYILAECYVHTPCHTSVNVI